MKIEAKKDGNGNILITENSFEMLLMCLDNQKFVNEAPQNGDSVSLGKDKYYKIQDDNQKIIDSYNQSFRKILHQDYVFELINDGYWLTKRYEFQEELTPWSDVDKNIVCDLFKHTKRQWEKPTNLKPIPDGTSIKFDSNPIGINEEGFIVCEPEDMHWLIERPLRYDNNYLTISEDGQKNRPWTQEEVEEIKKSFLAA